MADFDQMHPHDLREIQKTIIAVGIVASDSIRNNTFFEAAHDFPSAMDEAESLLEKNDQHQKLRAPKVDGIDDYDTDAVRYTAPGLDDG